MKKLTAQEASNLPEGYVNGATVVGVISGVGSKGNRSWAKIDGVELTAWDKDMSKFDGKTVELSGKRIKRETYNGNAKLSIGGETTITVVEDKGDVPTGSPAPARRQDDDFYDQTACHAMTGALICAAKDPQCDGLIPPPALIAQYIVAAMEGKEQAVAIKRGDL
jgi:hypothetical protein